MNKISWVHVVLCVLFVSQVLTGAILWKTHVDQRTIVSQYYLDMGQRNEYRYGTHAYTGFAGVEGSPATVWERLSQLHIRVRDLENILAYISEEDMRWVGRMEERQQDRHKGHKCRLKR